MQEQCIRSCWQMFFKIGVRLAALLKRESTTGVFQNLRNFKNFFYRTPLLWWLLLAVKGLNQWKHKLKIYAARKKWYTWTVLLRLAFLDKVCGDETNSWLNDKLPFASLGLFLVQVILYSFLLIPRKMKLREL